MSTEIFSRQPSHDLTGEIHPVFPQDGGPSARSSLGTSTYYYPGLEATLKGGHSFPLSEAMPLAWSGIERGYLESPMHELPREIIAYIEDWNLWRMSQAETILNLLMGEVLAELSKGGLSKLGYVKIGDFCREVVGISGRLGQELIRNATMLKSFPLAQEAYVKGKINKSGLRHLLRVIVPGLEWLWVRLAKKLAVRGLADKVKKWKEMLQAQGEISEEMLQEFFGEDFSGSDSENQANRELMQSSTHGYPAAVDTEGDDDGEDNGRWICEKVPLMYAALWDYVLEHYRRIEEADLSEGDFAEALLAEYFSSFPPDYWDENKPGGTKKHKAPDDGDEPDESDEYGETSDSSTEAENTEEPEDISRRDTRLMDYFYDRPSYREMLQETYKTLEEITDFWSFLPWKPVNILVPDDIKPDPSWMADPFVMAEKLKHMKLLKHRIAFHQGRILKNMKDFGLYREHMFASLDHYAKERLGISRNTLKTRLSMEIWFRSYPWIQDRFFEGRLTIEQAKLLIKVFKAGTMVEKEWLDYAESVSTLELSRTVRKFIRFAEIEPGERYSLSPWKIREWKDVWSAIEKWEKEEWQMCAQGERDSGEEKNEDGSKNCPESPESGQREKQLLPEPRIATVKFYLPGELQEIWDMARSDFEARCEAIEEPCDLTSFLMTLLHNFLETWPPARQKATFHDKVLERDHYDCSAPGCSCRRAVHAHHIEPKSQGGSNKKGNGSGLCSGHHLHCLHENGFIKVEGEAPDNLTVTLGVRPDGPPFAVFCNGVKVTENPAAWPGIKET